MRSERGRNQCLKARLLVLGVDVGHSRCDDLGVRIKEQTGNTLSVRDLRDPSLKEWREHTPSDEGDRAPTLFEVEDAKVKVWSGWRMGWVLSRTIGPAAAWLVMQTLREAGVASETQESILDEKLLEGSAFSGREMPAGTSTKRNAEPTHRSP